MIDYIDLPFFSLLFTICHIRIIAKSDSFEYTPLLISLRHSLFSPCVLKYLVFKIKNLKKKIVHGKFASHKVIVQDFFQNSESIVELF